MNAAIWICCINPDACKYWCPITVFSAFSFRQPFRACVLLKEFQLLTFIQNTTVGSCKLHLVLVTVTV
ncbi:hypothetical protein CS542_03410 [Pedobacter sp. IW39]|nr:hypothetical protein CS542_03410 [Pedobacter sp. IW39]